MPGLFNAVKSFANSLSPKKSGGSLFDKVGEFASSLPDSPDVKSTKIENPSPINPEDLLTPSQKILTNPVVDSILSGVSKVIPPEQAPIEQAPMIGPMPPNRTRNPITSFLESLYANNPVVGMQRNLRQLEGMKQEPATPINNEQDLLDLADRQAMRQGAPQNLSVGEIVEPSLMAGLPLMAGMSPLSIAGMMTALTAKKKFISDPIKEKIPEGTGKSAFEVADLLTDVPFAMFGANPAQAVAAHKASKILDVKSIIEKDLPTIKAQVKKDNPNLPDEVINQISPESIIEGAKTNPSIGDYLNRVQSKVSPFSKMGLATEDVSLPKGVKPPEQKTSKLDQTTNDKVPNNASSEQILRTLSGKGGFEEVINIAGRPLGSSIEKSSLENPSQQELSGVNNTKIRNIAQIPPNINPPTAVSPGPEEWSDSLIQSKSNELDLGPTNISDKAEMELEMMSEGNVHPLEKAMKQIGGIKFSDIEESFPTRFKGKKPSDEAMQELENNYGIKFSNDSEFHQALRSLGNQQMRFGLSDDVQQYLKNKENVDTLERKLSQTLKPGLVKKIIHSYVGVKKPKTDILIQTTEQQVLKHMFKVRQKASVEGLKEGVKLGEAKQINVSDNKIEAINRKNELQRLKTNILTRDKETANRAKLIAEYDAEISAIERKHESEKLKTDIIHRYKIKDIKEMAEKKDADLKTVKQFLTDYIRENLPTESRFKLIPEVRDLNTDNDLGKAILKVEKIKNELDAKKKAIEDAKRFTPEQRKELYQRAFSKGLIIKLDSGKTKDRLQGLLRYYKDASFGELKGYISELQGAEGNPPLVLKLFGDAAADTEVIKLINEASKDWRDINTTEIRTLDTQRIIEKVTGLDAWDNNILNDNFYDVLAGADAMRFDRMNEELKELYANSQGVLKDTKASAELMRKFEAGEALSASDQKIVDFLRSKYNALIKETNEVREKIGKKPIPYRQNYMTHIRDQNLLVDFFKGDIGKSQEISNEQLDAIRKGDFTKGNMKFNRFALERKGPRTKNDAIGNYEKYLETLLYEIYMTPAVTHARRFTDYALLRFPNAYEATTMLLNEMAGKPSALDKLMKPFVSNKVIKWIRQRIASNALIGNVGFNLLNIANLSTSSGELGTYALKGANGFLGNKELRDLAFKKSSVLKSRRGQFDADVKAISVFNPASFQRLTPVEMSKVGAQQLKYLTEGVTRSIEYFNVGSTWVGAYLKAIDKFKYSPEKAYKYADTIAKRTQVGYRPYELPAAMRSDTGKLFMQFQSWTFNAMNHLVYDLKLGNIPNSVRNKISNENLPTKVEYGKFIVLLGVLMLVNELYKRQGWREPTSLTSATPRVSFPAGRLFKAAGTLIEAGAGKTGADKLVGLNARNYEPETVKKAATTIASTLIPSFGGTQISRLSEGRVLPDSSKYDKQEVVELYEKALRTEDNKKFKEILKKANDLAGKNNVLIEDAMDSAERRVRDEIIDLYEEAIIQNDKKLIEKGDKIGQTAGFNEDVIYKLGQAAERRINKRANKEADLGYQQQEYEKKNPPLSNRIKDLISSL